MLYALHGEDTAKGREKLQGLIESLLKKKPDASILRFNDETFDISRLPELIHGQGLFEQKQIVVFDRVCESKETKGVVLKHLKDLALSPNIFVVFEGKLDKTTANRFEKRAEKVQTFDVEDSTSKLQKKFDVFSLTDALGARDRKKLWVLYRKAKANGVSDEEIHGILFWQVKSMLLVSGSSSPKESGLNPFVQRKATAFVKNYSECELVNMSGALISLSHDARRGISDFDTALERFVLGI